ncbi:transposase [Bacteroides faecium]|uniref:Transposase n=1 Tax=Bacteroides faecium TaxID=2715212 RepID=A0A6H0KPW7_9BACE|nr:transposase [Bacteroides faecium]QIU95506.1 transposase [Bacteroides faecium]
MWYNREAGSSMLAITGSMNIWFISNINDMHMRRRHLIDIVKDRFPNPYNGDMFAFMSKNRQLMKLVRYENRIYAL